MANQIQLPNNCRVSKFNYKPAEWLTGYPKNSGKTDADLLAEKWEINCRFYDDNRGESMQIRERSFGKIGNLKDRRAAVERMVSKITKWLEEGGNPFDNKNKPEKEQERAANNPNELSTKTPFTVALKLIAKTLKVAGDTITKEIDPAIKDIEAAAAELGYAKKAIWDVSLVDLYAITEKAAYRRDATYSGAKFNRHKKVLRQLYKEMFLLGLVQGNWPTAMPRRKEDAKEVKEPITLKERQQIDAYLLAQSVSPKLTFALREAALRFRLFLRIFFHSGGRGTEFTRVKMKHVDFKKQEIKYLVLKNGDPVYVTRPMLDVAVDLWKEACEGANPDDYVFGTGLMPGAEPTTKNAIKLRWERLQDALNLRKGMYQMKHTHTTEVRRKLGLKAAATMNAESEEMINKHYDLEKGGRENDALKKVKIKFA